MLNKVKYVNRSICGYMKSQQIKIWSELQFLSWMAINITHKSSKEHQKNTRNHKLHGELLDWKKKLFDVENNLFSVLLHYLFDQLPVIND